MALTVLTLSFLLTRISGDLAISIAGPNATQADVDLIRRAYGLDRPVTQQYFDWLVRALQGDFGESFFFKDRVANPDEFVAAVRRVTQFGRRHVS